jgi:hypothetical protein
VDHNGDRIQRFLAVVWKVVADFRGYGSWHPIIKRISGELTVGKRLGLFARLPCGLPMALWPRVLEVEGGRKLKWLGSLALPGLLDGEHLLVIESLAEVRVAKTLAGYRTGLLNYFKHPITSAMVEGINNKIKTLKRQAYGFRDKEYFRLRLYHLHTQRYALAG